MTRRVAVIGGGLAGTSAAYWLARRGYEVTIFEQNNYLGGRIRSELAEGLSIELGAAFLTDAYTNMLAFLAETGMSSQLYRQTSRVGIFHDQRTVMMGIRALASNTPLSWHAKANAIPLIFKTLTAWRKLDLHDFSKAAEYDIRPVSSMFSGSGGRAFLECMLQPILNGYFYWAPEHTSESMMLMLCKAAFSHRTYRLEGGLQRIPEQAANGSTVRLRHTVKRVTQTSAGYIVTAEHKGKANRHAMDGVVCATTADMVPVILPSLNNKQAQFFKKVAYSSTSVVAQVHKDARIIDSTSIAFPRREGVVAASVSVAADSRTQTSALAAVKIYASGKAAPQLSGLSDARLAQSLTDAASPACPTILASSSEPVTSYTQRWTNALPFCDVGHFKRLRAFAHGEIEDAACPLTFAGDYLGGPFMEGAYTSGIRAAERLHTRLHP